jgi:hypothetical protein
MINENNDVYYVNEYNELELMYEDIRKANGECPFSNTQRQFNIKKKPNINFQRAVNAFNKQQNALQPTSTYNKTEDTSSDNKSPIKPPQKNVKNNNNRKTFDDYLRKAG